MEKSPGPGLFTDFTDFWSQSWKRREGGEGGEIAALHLEKTHTNNRNTNDGRGEGSQRKATPECCCGLASISEGLTFLPEGRFYDQRVLGATAREREGGRFRRSESSQASITLMITPV